MALMHCERRFPCGLSCAGRSAPTHGSRFCVRLVTPCRGSKQSVQSLEVYRWNWRVSGLLGTPGTRLGGRLPGAASPRQSPAFCVMPQCMTRSHSTVCSITKIARATTKQPVPNTAWCRFPFNCAEIIRAVPAKTSSAERITLAIFIRCYPVGTGEQLQLRFILNINRAPNVPTLALRSTRRLTF
jgi:hypothetical protein